MGWFRSCFCPKSVFERRHELSEYWMAHFEGNVAYGPFSGLKLGAEFGWSAGDLAAKLFGLYEQEVLAEFCRLAQGRDVLIDIGAADGYYANGSLVSGLVNRCVAFEANQKSRKIIMENARLNGVSDRITIEGAASERKIVNLLSELDHERALVLIDIEGGEFDLLTENLIRSMRCPMIIELHEWMIADGEDRPTALMERLNGSYEVSVITNDVRDLSGLSELKTKNDDHRWLICSEGRGRQMEWLICVPKNVSIMDSTRD